MPPYSETGFEDRPFDREAVGVSTRVPVISLTKDTVTLYTGDLFV